MATSYGWAGNILRVDLTAGTCVSYPTNAFPLSDGTVVDMTQYIGGHGIGYRVLASEVPVTTKAWDPANRIIFGVGPITGSGSPSSGRTSITCLWPVHKDELPDGGQMGGHWGPELKYAGYDAIVIQGASPSPVWLRIQDGTATLEDASMIWGSGIYFSTNYIVNDMGPEAHVACIGQTGENLVRMAGIFCDRSHRAGGVGGIMGSKNLKAIGVQGTGSVKIAADKTTWKSLVNYYLSLMGCNNQGVVAKTLQAWSEYSPGGTRWSGAKGVLWGAATPPRDLGDCPDVEHPTATAPSPINKIGLRTQKGYNDFGDEGMKRTVRMDGCHACPIRCHIAADHPQLLNYGVTRYNMNTCTGNNGINMSISNSAGSNPSQNPMLLAYMGNSLEGDYGLWSDYQGYTDAFKWYYKAKVANPLGGPALIPMLQKYLSDAEWKTLTATALWSSGLPPMGPAGYATGTVSATNGSPTVTGAGTTWSTANGVVAGGTILIAGVSYAIQTVNSTTSLTLASNYLGPTATGVSYIAENTTASSQSLLDNGDPRWLQYIMPYIAQNQTYNPPVVNSFGVTVYGTLGYYLGIGPDRLAHGDSSTGFPGWPELLTAMETLGSLTFFKMGHQKHHSIESNGNLGAMINMMQRNRDPNNHTLQCFYTNGLPASLKVAISQELTTQGNSIFNAPDESAQGNYAWWDGVSTAVNSPMCAARAAWAASAMVNMELHNAITQCNYTLPVWASPLKSRNYRGDATLEAQTFEKVTGLSLIQFTQSILGVPAYSPIIGAAPANPTPQQALETLALRNFTLYRCLTAIRMQYANPNSVYTLQTSPAATYSQYTPLSTIPSSYGVPQLAPTNLPGDGNNMRFSHDYAYPWNYCTQNGPGTAIVAGNSGSPTTYLDVMGVGDTEAAKSLVYQQLGWELNSGLPTQTTLNALGLEFMIPKMQAAGITVPA